MNKLHPYAVLNKILQWLWLALGGAGLFFWGVGTLGIALDEYLRDTATIVIGGIFTVLSGLLFWRGLRRRKLARAYRGYRRHFAGMSYGTFRELAQIMGCKEDEVPGLIEQMLRRGMIYGVGVDEAGRQVVLLSGASAPEELRYVTCTRCGGTSQIPVGGFGICDYCGSPLETE